MFSNTSTVFRCPTSWRHDTTTLSTPIGRSLVLRCPYPLLESSMNMEHDPREDWENMMFPWFSGWNDGSGMGSPASIGHALASHNHLQSLKLLTQRFCSNRWAWWTSSALSLYMHIYYIYACAPVYICGEILHIYLSTYKSIYLSTYLSIYL